MDGVSGRRETGLGTGAELRVQVGRLDSQVDLGGPWASPDDIEQQGEGEEVSRVRNGRVPSRGRDGRRRAT